MNEKELQDQEHAEVQQYLEEIENSKKELQMKQIEALVHHTIDKAKDTLLRDIRILLK